MIDGTLCISGPLQPVVRRHGGFWPCDEPAFAPPPHRAAYPDLCASSDISRPEDVCATHRTRPVETSILLLSQMLRRAGQHANAGACGVECWFGMTWNSRHRCYACRAHSSTLSSPEAIDDV